VLPLRWQLEVLSNSKVRAGVPPKSLVQFPKLLHILADGLVEIRTTAVQIFRQSVAQLLLGCGEARVAGSSNLVGGAQNGGENPLRHLKVASEKPP
jgi:hypothetical protein